MSKVQFSCYDMIQISAAILICPAAPVDTSPTSKKKQPLTLDNCSLLL